PSDDGVAHDAADEVEAVPGRVEAVGELARGGDQWFQPLGQHAQRLGVRNRVSRTGSPYARCVRGARRALAVAALLVLGACSSGHSGGGPSGEKATTTVVTAVVVDGGDLGEQDATSLST